MWRVYYDDGTFSENEVTQPYRVIAIAQPREKTGREVLHAYPYYILKNGSWCPCEDIASLVQQLVYYAKDIESVVMGIWIDGGTYTSIVHKATTDEGLPRRSAKDPDRRR
jgi:hypothetical protein